MRRSPFHAHPNSDHYAPAAGGAYRPRRLFPHTTSPNPASHSVVTIPVHDSSSPLPPHQQPTKPSTVAITPPAPTLDRASAATRIQSCFRGFAVRHHKPLFHLRSVAAVSRQLEELRSELETPGFPSRVRTSDKERLRFNENVMALLLRLDAVKGAIPEVRSQRKEATRKAIQLQDAIDAIMMEGEEEQPSPNCMEGPPSSDKLANIQVLDTCAGAGPQSESRPEPMIDLIHTPDIDDAVFAKGFVTDAPSKEVAAQECAMLSPNVQDVVQDSVSLTEKGQNNSDDSNPAVPADGEIQDDLAFIKLMQNHGTNDSEQGSHAHISENQPSCLHRSTNPDEGDVRNGTERMVSNAEASVECLPNEASAGATMIPESHCDRLSPSKGQEQQECLSTSESSVLGGIIDRDIVPCSLREVATAMECRSVYQTPKVDGGTDQGAGAASTIVCQAISPSTIAEEEVAAVSFSDRVLLQQLSKDCKQLKSLLAKLLIQSRAQSKAMSALGDRLEMLEQQQNLRCQKQQQLCRKAKCKKGSSKKGKKERAYHSKARTFKCYDDE